MFKSDEFEGENYEIDRTYLETYVQTLHGKLGSEFKKYEKKLSDTFESTTGKKMSVAMGLVDNITTSSLQAEIEYEPNFYDWLNIHVK